MARKVAVAIIRNDLRMHDHYAFNAACQSREVTHILPLYVFDERTIELGSIPGFNREGPEARTRLCKFWRSGVFRARFLAESVYDLQNRLRDSNCDLLVRFGKTEKVALKVVKALLDNGDEVKHVFMQKENCSEEVAQENKLKKGLSEHRVHLTLFDTNPLIHPDDLPFPVSQVPDVFTPFRKRVEGLPKLCRDPLYVPDQLKPFASLPQTADTGFGGEFDGKGIVAIWPHLLEPLKDVYETRFLESSKGPDSHSAFPYTGGETSALERLKWYFLEGDPPPVARYKETRNGLLGHAYSTKLSPFLCLGTISSRTVMQYLDEHEARYGETKNTYWVRFELLWRDYFIYIARKFGTKLFKLEGFEAITDPKQARIKTQPGWWKGFEDGKFADNVQRWMEGRTGVPFIDANMAELLQSGFMSNRGRQNVASFLTKDLQVDWRIGAEFFESHLIDFEPTANWGNWQYVAGVGNDPRASRQFNPIKQGNDYDPQGDFIRTWLPALQAIPVSRIQAPWLLSDNDWQKLVESKGQRQSSAGPATGQTDTRRHIQDSAYPRRPIIEQPNWKPHYDRRGRGTNKTRGNPNEKIKNPGPAIKKTGQAQSVQAQQGGQQQQSQAAPGQQQQNHEESHDHKQGNGVKTIPGLPPQQQQKKQSRRG